MFFNLISQDYLCISNFPPSFYRLEAENLRLPKAMTFHVLSVDALKSLANMSLEDDHVEKPSTTGDDQKKINQQESKCLTLCNSDEEPSLVLAGLHACGDLSVIMLRLE